MSDLAQEFGLRAPAGAGAAPAKGKKGKASTDGKELFHRTAKKDGRRVVILRCFDRDGACVVECDVYPTNSLRVEPLHPGPYTFTTRDEASGFIEEALLALEYLGCDIS
jgi:uncharacterized protein YjhX (UPF0386 family)